PALLHARVWGVIAVIAMAIGSAVLGDWAGRPEPNDRTGFATFAVLGNPALALAVVSATFPGFRASAVVAGYLIVRALALIPYNVWSKRRTDHQQQTLTPDLGVGARP